MKKIIFTDLFDTIATKEIAKHPNSDKAKEEYQYLQNFLSQYLTPNNFIFIISKMEPLTLEHFLMIFEKLISKLDKEQLKNLSFYLTGTKPEKITLPKNFNIVLEKKENIANQLIRKNKITTKDKILSAGNDGNDINMLFKVYDMGGTSYFINEYYYQIAQTLDDSSLLKEIASKETTLAHMKPIPKENLNEISKESQIVYNNMLKKLQHLYNSKKITREQLINMYSILTITKEYNTSTYSNSKKNKDNIKKKLILVNDRKDIFKNFLD